MRIVALDLIADSRNRSLRCGSWSEIAAFLLKGLIIKTGLDGIFHVTGQEPVQLE